MNCVYCNREIESDELVYAIDGNVYCYGCAIESGIDDSESKNESEEN